MISQIITHYLADHKRLVVPQLGAFIVKVPGREVVFSELMKRDDGTLRELLRREGMNEIEAAGAIDRFVFEIRHTAESDSVYRAEGLGVFAAGPNGTIRFRFLPQEDPSDEERRAEPEEEKPAPDAVPERAEEPAGTTEHAGQNEEQRQAAEEAPAEETRRKIRELMKHEPDRPGENRSSSQPRRPDPSVRGLRYGRPQKTTDAYTYVNSAPSRRPDTFVILAVVVIVLALCAILYGYFNDRRAQQQEQEYIESIASQGIDPADEGAFDPQEGDAM